MSDRISEHVSRRSFLAGASALAASVLPGLACAASGDPPPETTRLRIANGPFICYAPQLLAEEFLRLEGFTEVEYVPVQADNTLTTIVGRGRVDLAVFGPSNAVYALDASWLTCGNCLHGHHSMTMVKANSILAQNSSAIWPLALVRPRRRAALPRAACRRSP